MVFGAAKTDVGFIACCQFDWTAAVEPNWPLANGGFVDGIIEIKRRRRF